ncbi:MAG: hypothetical protein JXA21_00735 [Anaerolineae bacterium]|nr:hypothetical protein [Anaerolineae bacterium]
MTKQSQHKNIRKKAALAWTVVLLILNFGIQAPVVAATLTVDGTCVDGDGDGRCDTGTYYKTIQAAVDAAVADDTILVLPATYPERVQVTKPLIITGDPGSSTTAGPGVNAPIVDGEGGAGYGFRIMPGIDNVTIEGFIIRNFGTGPEAGGGQSVGVGAANYTTNPTTNITVRYNRFDAINWASVFFFNTGQSLYQNIDIRYNDVNVGPWALNTNVYGIECTNCANAVIALNEVSGGVNGIVLSAQGTAATPITASGNAILTNTVTAANEGDILLMSYDPNFADGAPLLQNTTIQDNQLTNDGTLGSEGNSAILVYSHANGVLSDLDILNNTVIVTNSDNIPIDLATTANINISDNTIVARTPDVNGPLLYLNTVGGSHINVLRNEIHLEGSVMLDHFHAVELNGGEAPGRLGRNGTALWSRQHPFPVAAQAMSPRSVMSRPGFEGARIDGNTFVGNNVGAQSAAIRLRSTLPATATVSVLNNNITGFSSAIWANAPRNFFVRNNQLIQNGYGINTTGTGAKLGLIATGNVISGNSIAGIELIGTGALPTTIGGSLANFNTFRNNGPGGALNLRVNLPTTNPIVDATFNDWEVTDVCDIAATFNEQSGVLLVNYYDIAANATPSAVPADGVTASDITGILSGLYAPAGNIVSFTTNLGTLNPLTDLADTVGEAHSAITSNVAGVASVVATAGMACAYTEAAQTTVNFGIVNYVYLPLILRNYLPLPDLVVTALAATSNGITVTIQNQGTAPVDDAFWVDVYIAPTTPPQSVNEIWSYVGDSGLAWGIPANLTPMAPGAVMTLTVGDAYYYPEFSAVTWPLTASLQIYAQVDSNNPATTYGGVLESHEYYGETYNNVSVPVMSLPGMHIFHLESPRVRPASLGDLPPRP